MDDGRSQREPVLKPAGGRRARHRLVDICMLAVVVLAVVAIAVLNLTDVTADHAMANVGTLIAGFAALVTVLLWFALFGPLAWWVRLLPLVVLLSLCAVFFSLFRIENVSGELMPRFVWRYAHTPDELLERPQALGPTTGTLVTVDLLATTDDDFPQFLGPQRSGAIDTVGLAPDWQASPPRLLWRQAIGAGWSGFAVVGGHALTMEQRGELEMVTCYSVADGRLEWFHAVPVRYDSTIAGIGPRATPTVHEGMVYTLGAKGHLLCLDGATGRCIWQKELWKEFGITEADEEAEVSYGRANSPLVVGELVIVPAGGPHHPQWTSLVAYDRTTGQPVWKGGKQQISYSSPALAILGGVEQVLIVNQDYASGHELRTGKVLWEYQWPGKSDNNANVSQAVPLPPDRVFLSKGYGHGAALVQLVPRHDGTFDAQKLWHSSRVMRTKFCNVALWQGYVYGLSDGILECIELESGQRMWKAGRYGHGQSLRVGELLLVLSESGQMSLVEATPQQGNNVLGQFQALDDQDETGYTWNPFAVAGPYLLVRNAQQAACYELPLEGP
jgi:outer membrane protein assembly factor BamB